MKHELEKMRREIEELKEFKARCQQLPEVLNQEKENFFRVFYSSSNPMSIMAIKENRIIDINEAFIRLSGFSREELLGHSVDELPLLADPGQMPLLVHKLQEEGRVPSVELRALAKTGAPLTILLSADSIIINGEPCMLTAAIDITAQKKESEALRQSEERYRMLVENSLQGVAIIQDGVFIFCNGTYARMTGYTIEELLGKAPEELSLMIHPDDRENVRIRHRELLAGKTVEPHYEYRGIKKDGTEFTLEVYDSLTEYNGRPAIQLAYLDITERKRAEEAARESGERLKLALEASGMAAWDVNNQTGEIVDDAWWLPSLGYKPGEIELTLSSVNSLMHPDDLPKIERAATDHLEGRSERYSIEYRIRNKSGTWDWVLDQGKLVSRDSLGKPLRTMGVHLNITEQKQAEEKLRRLNRELRAISDCNQTLIRAEDEQSLLNDICRIISDEAGYRLVWVGYAENDSEKSVRPVAWAGFENGYLAQANISWADTERGRGPVGRAIRSGRAIYSQDFMQDPMFIPWRESALQRGYRSGIFCPLRDEASNIFGTLNIYSADSHAFTADEIRLLEELAGDLTFGISVLRARIERRRAEEALKESKEYLNQILNSLGDPLFVKNRGHRCVLVNEAFCAFLGRKREELLGTDCFDLLPAEIADSLKKKDDDIFVTGKEDTTEDALPDLNGNVHTFITKKSLVTDKSGDRLMIGVLRDITEYKRLQAQFQQAQKMEAVGILAGGVAHDFNNLLNVINGYCELLLEDFAADDSRRNELEQISLAGKRATSLTSQLLAFSRKQIMQPEFLDLNSVIAGMNVMLRRLIRENIELMVIPQQGLGLINADPGQIQQVIMNLAVNARDAMPQGGKLTIETSNVYLDEECVREHPAVKPGSYVMMAISDNGIGMNENTRSHLFEPFFTTKGKGKGTGLGLSTVYGIVKQSSGFVWVHSEPEKGSAFKIYFPKVEGSTSLFQEEDKLKQSPQGNETILITEDDSSLRALVARILAERGYAVLEASNGKEALDIAEKYAGEIHLVITDVIMPGIGGKELASRLSSARPGMKVLFVSGYTDSAIGRHGVLDPGVSFLQKPFTIENLTRKVRAVLDAQP